MRWATIALALFCCGCHPAEKASGPKIDVRKSVEEDVIRYKENWDDYGRTFRSAGRPDSSDGR